MEIPLEQQQYTVREEAAIVRQWHSKHVSTAANTRATIEE
jgi:hypothetical protein